MPGDLLDEFHLNLSCVLKIILGMKYKFTKYLREGYGLSSNEQPPFKYFQNIAFVGGITKIVRQFWLLWA